LAQKYIKSTFDNSYGLEYPIVQYVDDTLIILPADETKFCSLKELLHKFCTSTGKTSMIPINMSAERCVSLAEASGCKAEAFNLLGLAHGYH
jgi:hypothetical protein